MIRPESPRNETERLNTLCSLDVLDTAPEERFDRITRLAKRIFEVPIVLVSLIDENRQWFKSRQGLDASETPRDISFCGHAILANEPLVVPDALLDERFSDNPLVTDDPWIRFYAGYPLTAKNGCRLGTLCLIDRVPRNLSKEDVDILGDLAGMVEQELAALELATTDGLTGLSNRRGFETLGAHSLAVCRRLRKRVSLLFIDLDEYKSVNDRGGHAEGDRILVEFAEVLNQTFRDCDVVARIGGDEFCVLMTGKDEVELAPSLLRLEERVDEFNRVRSTHPIHYSVGIADFGPERHGTLAEIVDKADRAMYRDKRDSQHRLGH